MWFRGTAEELRDWFNNLIAKHSKDAKIVDMQEVFNG